LTATLGRAFGLVAVGLGRNVSDGRNLIDGSTGWLDNSSVGRPASRWISARDGGSNRSTAGSGTWVRRVSTNALPSTTAIKQIAQTPHFRTAARTPDSSLNIGRSVLTTTEESPLAKCPRSPETPDMLKHADEAVYAAMDPAAVDLVVRPKRGRCRLVFSEFLVRSAPSPDR
jgi:hypothetical protein